MDETRLQRILHVMSNVILSQSSQILELLTSVTVLKAAIANLRGEALESVLSEFQEREAMVLKELPISQQLRELREMMDLFAKYGGAFGKNQS